MKEIHVLEQKTIDKIAAGEVVERPGSIVKELCENALDAGASAITVEIRDGGISMIRVTDNGEGIAPSQVRNAFLRHATSKITEVDDLLTIRSFGFRGEALSSISAVSRVELITKVRENLTGIRYKIEGGSEKLFEEVGAPEGSTFIVRDLFYNTPARRKFLKSVQTEAGCISDFVSRLALSHPEIAVKFMVNSTTRLSTSGFGSQADVISSVFGRDIRANLIEADCSDEEHGLHMKGWIGKPQISRGNRSQEILYVNGRLVYNNIFSKAIEEGYETFLMQHKFPFVILSLTLPGSDVDVNVHPAKAQVRFSQGPIVYAFIKNAVKDLLNGHELIIDTTLATSKEEAQALKDARKRALAAEGKKDVPEPFEQLRREHQMAASSKAGNPESHRNGSGSESWQQSPARGYIDGQGQGISPYSRKYPEEMNPQPHSLESAGTSETTHIQDHPDRQYPDDQSPDHQYPDHQYPDHQSPDRQSPDHQNLYHQNPGQYDSGHRKTTTGYVRESHSPSPEEIRRSNEFLEEVSRIPSGGDAYQKGRSKTMTIQEWIDGSDISDRSDQAVFLTREHQSEHRLIGQLFETYWIVEFRNSMYIIDQHAAHEKVMFERLMEKYRQKKAASQMISPSIVVSLSLAEETLLKDNMEYFNAMGFEIEPFGGHDYAISAVPQDLFGLTEREFFMEMLDSLSADAGKMSIETVTMRVATMACKAAVKGNTRLSRQEAEKLISELLTLDNPYNCPHGRPTILSMSKSEIEKKFHRIV